MSLCDHCKKEMKDRLPIVLILKRPGGAEIRALICVECGDKFEKELRKSDLSGFGSLIPPLI